MFSVVQAASETTDDGYAYEDKQLLPRWRKYEQRAGSLYSKFLKAHFFYECVSYDVDNKPIFTKKEAAFYGSSFAFHKENTHFYLMTTDHFIRIGYTEPGKMQQKIDPSCKVAQVKYSLLDELGRNQKEDDWLLDVVAEERTLDAAILRWEASVVRSIEILPYVLIPNYHVKMGDSVWIRGYSSDTVGVFPAFIIAPEQNWDKPPEILTISYQTKTFLVNLKHDSQLDGSPVLAINPKTGNYELVGMVLSKARGNSGFVSAAHIQQFSLWMQQVLQMASAKLKK